jgi:hypothetical protein
MTRIALVLAALAATLVLAGEALACSCAPFDPRDALEGSDGAFVGTLLERVVEGEEALHTFRVEEAVKGDLGDTVVVRSHRDGATCGLEVPVGERVGLFLQRAGAGWESNLCQQIHPDELLAAAQPLPAPTGSGPVALLVGGSFGDMRTIALDEQGRVLAYGPGEGETVDIAVCPGGGRAVESVLLPGDTSIAYRLEVRDLATMAIVGVLGPGIDWGTASPGGLRCLDAGGTEAAVFASSDVGPDRVVVAGAEGVRTIWRGQATYGSFGPKRAFVCAGAKGRTVVAVSLATGAKERIARVPAFTGPLTPSPGGRLLAGVAVNWDDFTDPKPSRAVLVDTKRGSVRTAPLGGPYVSGDMLWLSSSRVALVPNGGEIDRVRVYDTALRLRALGEQLYAYDAALHEGRLIGLVAPFLVAAPSPTGTFSELARLPSPVVHVLEAVAGGPAPPARAIAWRH